MLSVLNGIYICQFECSSSEFLKLKNLHHFDGETYLDELDNEVKYEMEFDGFYLHDEKFTNSYRNCSNHQWNVDKIYDGTLSTNYKIVYATLSCCEIEEDDTLNCYVSKNGGEPVYYDQYTYTDNILDQFFRWYEVEINAYQFGTKYLSSGKIRRAISDY